MGDGDNSPGSASARAVGFDIGGTKVAYGLVGRTGPVSEATVVPTPREPQALVDLLTDTVTTLRDREPALAAVGVGAAGLVDWPSGHIRWAPHNSYRNLPMRELLERSCGLPAVVDNDANAAAYAEARLGDLPDHTLFVAVGTGIGGGLILGGEVYRGARGLGGEVGHMVVDASGGVRCACGVVGCLEALASGTALGRAGRRAAVADPTGRLARLAGDPTRVTGVTVTAAAAEGDPTARALYAEAGRWLGIALASLVTVLDVAQVVVGGGVTAAGGDLLLEPARQSLRAFLFARDHREVPPVVPASQGPDAGWIGAGLLALSRLSAAAP